MRKKSIPVLIAGGCVVLLLLIVGIIALINKYTPSKERMELSEYYNLSDENQVAIVLNDSVCEAYGTLIDGHVYLDYQFVHDNINSRFYWDANENILLYTTASNVISANAGDTGYYIGKSSKDYGRTIVKATADSALVDIDFINAYSNFVYSYYESPSRVVITGAREELAVATVKKNTEIRCEDDIKSSILLDLKKGTSVNIVEEDKKWSKICTEDGISGYIRSNCLKDYKTTNPAEGFVEEEFLHIKKDEPISLVWHWLDSKDGNTKISQIISDSKGLNVISPTWFRLKDNKGNISSIASKDYVDYCHAHDVEVWGLVSDFELDGVDSSYVLTHTSARQNLVNQLIAVALQYNLDGINVDFEAENVTAASVGDGYIQFIRELSIKCENNDIILSTDVRVPAPHNSFFEYGEQSNFVDYVILMAYDEHWGPGSGEGSVASLNWVEKAVTNTLAEGVPSDQIVLGMPFYSKIWTLTPTIDEETSEIVYSVNDKAYGMTYSKNWMNDHVKEPVWLEDCGQWYGEYTDDGIIYKLWLEDNDSLVKRLELMKENSLAGAAFWRSGFENKEVWDTIIKYIN